MVGLHEDDRHHLIRKAGIAAGFSSRRNSALRPRGHRGCDSREPPNSPVHPPPGTRCFAAISRSSRNRDADDQPHRAAVFLLQRHARPAVHEQGVFGGKVIQRQIGGVAVMAMQHDVAGLQARLAGVEEIARRQPLPLIVIARPGGHAMDVGDAFGLRLRGELCEVPEDRMFDRAVDVEPPAVAGNLRRHAEIEHRPVPGEVLSGRQALLFRPGGLAGEEAALARPALFAARKFGFRLLVALLGHLSCHCCSDNKSLPATMHRYS